MKWAHWIFLLLVLPVCALKALADEEVTEEVSPPAHKENLDFVPIPKKAIQRVKNSIFEVVVDKQEDDFIKYERTPPLDKIPFQIRNDKYIGLGTAFAAGPNRYVSAAHV